MLSGCGYGKRSKRMTEEELKKIPFRCVGSMALDDEHTLAYTSEDGHPFAVWFDEPVDIKYVHQLQHVLRLYGAEKEIKIKED